MSVGIKNQSIDTTAIIPSSTTAPPTPLPEDPQEGWTEDQKVNFIREALAETERLGAESKSFLKKSATMVFMVGKALDFNRNKSEGAIGDWVKKHKLKWTPCREAMRLYWRCDSPEKQAELANLTITQAKRQYQCRYATFDPDRYKPKTKPAGPVVDQLQDALVKLTAILDAATTDDWHQAEDHLGTVSAQIDDVMAQLSEVKQVIDAIIPVGQNAEPEKTEASKPAAAVETPEKKPRRKAKAGDDRG